jgi:hypothetical protein
MQTAGYATWDGTVTQRDFVGFNADYTGVSCGLTWCDVAGQCAGLIVGVAICQVAGDIAPQNGQRECGQHRVYFDSDALGGSAQYLHALACHETGHTLGLTHTGGTCMVSPVDASQIGFSADQRTHINDWY